MNAWHLLHLYLTTHSRVSWAVGEYYRRATPVRPRDLDCQNHLFLAERCLKRTKSTRGVFTAGTGIILSTGEACLQTVKDGPAILNHHMMLNGAKSVNSQPVGNHKVDSHRT